MSLTKMSDHELMANFQDLVIEERENLALQLEYIAELDRRKLFYHYSSLRAFLIEEHGMEEWNAERKIRAARLLKRFPEITGKLQSGRLNLTLLELAMGCAHREKLLDPEISEILSLISGLSTRAAMREIASLYPQTAELPKDQIRPINSDYSEVRFAASHELLEKLDEIRGLLAHSHPEGLTMNELLDVLATEYRKRHHPEEKAKRSKKVDSPTAPRVQSAEVTSPSIQKQSVERRGSHLKETRVATPAVLHQLTNRDGYQCSFIDEVTQKRCLSRYKLEVDHVQPWSTGGKTELSNLRYLCSQHHRRVSFLQFGESSKYFKSHKTFRAQIK